MPTKLDVRKTQAAWRDFAIGLVVFLVALRVLQASAGFGLAGLVVGQALLIGVVVMTHVSLHRAGRFREVTGAVASPGRVGARRLAVVAVGALGVMCSVWRIAEMLGGPIDRPLLWGQAMLERGGVSFAYFFAVTLYALVTAPVIEELCFRGWMQRGLAQRFNPVIAIVTPAVLFAALHASVYSHPAYLLIPLALGLTFGLVAERSGALWPAVVLHALWNLTMLAVAARGAARPGTPPPPASPLVVLALLGGIGLGWTVVLRVLPRVHAGAEEPGSAAMPDTQAA